jgi:WD40 repeat protein
MKVRAVKSEGQWEVFTRMMMQVPHPITYETISHEEEHLIWTMDCSAYFPPDAPPCRAEMEMVAAILKSDKKMNIDDVTFDIPPPSSSTDSNWMRGYESKAVPKDYLIRTLTGHTEGVNGVAFSPDGKLLVSGGRDNRIMLWDVQTGELKRTFEGHENLVAGVVFSRDAKSLFSNSRDLTIRVWDVASGREVKKFKRFTDGPSSHLSLSSDDSLIAISDKYGTVEIWDSKDGAILRQFKYNSNYIPPVAFSPDGETVATSGGNLIFGPVFWEVRTQRHWKSLFQHRVMICSIAWSPDARRIATGAKDGSMLIWDMTKAVTIMGFLSIGPLLQLKGHGNAVFSVEFSPDGSLLASGSVDKTIKVWSASTGQLLRTMEHPDFVYDATFSPDGRILASASMDKKIRLWRIDDLY